MRGGVGLANAASIVASAAWLWVGAEAGGGCSSRPVPPPLPNNATAYNGVVLPEVCYGNNTDGNNTEGLVGAEHFFIIGDWGGVGVPPRPADNRRPGSRHERAFVHGVDDRAQQLVAAQMKRRAAQSHPRYVINVGDNFYWGGVDDKCAFNRSTPVPGREHMQFKHIFERMYDGPDLAGKPWLGVLGNHDYGGWQFTKAWDQAVTYTWSSDRWLTPALYWSQLIRYPDFTVEYFFVDTNVFDAHHPLQDPNHNICGMAHNLDPGNRWALPDTCHGGGPASVWECPAWFAKLWAEQLVWLDRQLQRSTADWRIVVTHFPPEYGLGHWWHLAHLHGLDLIITGHRHQQEVHPPGFLPAYVVSGGGGGITSESIPNLDGHDDQYGFMDVTISRDRMLIEAISHGGIIRSSTVLHRRATSSTTTTSLAARRISEIVVAPIAMQGRDTDSALIATAGVLRSAGLCLSAILVAALLSLEC